MIVFFAAVLLFVVFAPIGMIYTFVRLMIRAKIVTYIKRVDQYFFAMALAMDQLGNVLMKEIFNDLLIKKEGHQFGDEDETISSVVGKNKEAGTLRFLGKCLDKVLDLIDPGHSINAIE